MVAVPQPFLCEGLIYLLSMKVEYPGGISIYPSRRHPWRFLLASRRCARRTHIVPARTEAVLEFLLIGCGLFRIGNTGVLSNVTVDMLLELAHFFCP
jgi:hypothetical protein